MKPIRILIAQEPAYMAAVEQALQGYELLCCTHIQEAERLLIEDGIDLFVIGIHFDDSHAMELIKFIRRDKRHAKSPIVVIRLKPSKHAGILRQTLDVMQSLLLISEYIEEDGNNGIEQRLREAVANAIQATRKVHKKVPKLD